jgi:dipeptidyl aminopeptidase/acylaminoacyl peptidase
MPRRRLCVVGLVLAGLLTGQGACARPFTVDDLLHRESLGAMVLDPTGRWFVYERRDRYDTATRYDYGLATSQTLGRLQVIDLQAPGPARPLLAHDPGPGVLVAGFSPGGRRLAVYRIQGRSFRFGVVDLASGSARFFDFTPQEPLRGRALQWLSDTELLVIARGDEHAPVDLRQGSLMTDELPRRWAAAARGEGSHTVLGSGAYAGLRERAAPARLLDLDLASGSVRELAQGAFIDLELSPDHRRVALLESGKDLQPRQDGPVRGPAGFETEATEVSILDLRTNGRIRPGNPGDVLPNLLAWSPDSRALLLYRRGADGLWTSGGLERLDAATGRIRSVGPGLELQPRLNPVAVRAGWMGDVPIAAARRAGQAQAAFDWWRLDGATPRNLTGALPPGERTLVAAGRRGLAVIAGNRLWRVDPAGRVRAWDVAQPVPALRSFRGTQGSRLVNALPAGGWIRTRRGGAAALAWVDAQGPLAAFGLPDSSDELVAVSRGLQAAVLRDVDAHGVERLTLARSGAPPRTLAALNPELAATDPPRIAPVRHSGSHGEPLTSWLFLPREAVGRPPPLVVRPYLGASAATPPHDGYMEAGFFQNLRVLTGHGYAVLVPSLPNPPGGLVEPADHVAERILAVVAAAEADSQLAGMFDPGRLALVGWSFGGYTTMAAITQTDRFRAAVEMDGISDLTAYWASVPAQRLLAPDEGYPGIWHAGAVEQTQPEMHAPPWREPERYRRNSPLLAADRIHTPLLLIHGAQDVVPSAGSEAMYSALFRQGKDAILVTYWGAQHSVDSPGDVRDVYARTFAFLDAYLAPGAP